MSIFVASDPEPDPAKKVQIRPDPVPDPQK
jgi:hypothetical protein